MIVKIEKAEEKTAICRKVLESLPQWFGLEDSREEYCQMCQHYPFWAAYHNDAPCGCIAMKETSAWCAEIYVMGVLPTLHRQGIGKALYATLYETAKKQGYEFLQVKTVKEGCYACYDKTNAFYRRLGFKELECFETLWDEHNPCQLYILHLPSNDLADITKNHKDN